MKLLNVAGNVPNLFSNSTSFDSILCLLRLCCSNIQWNSMINLPKSANFNEMIAIDNSNNSWLTMLSFSFFAKNEKIYVAAFWRKWRGTCHFFKFLNRNIYSVHCWMCPMQCHGFEHRYLWSKRHAALSKRLSRKWQAFLSILLSIHCPHGITLSLPTISDKMFCNPKTNSIHLPWDFRGNSPSHLFVDMWQ